MAFRRTPYNMVHIIRTILYGPYYTYHMYHITWSIFPILTGGLLKKLLYISTPNI